MVFIQHALTRRYLQSFAEWSVDLQEAWEFANTAEASHYCEWRGLKDVHMVVVGDQSVYHLPLPTPSPIRVEQGGGIPVVLPRVNMRAN